ALVIFGVVPPEKCVHKHAANGEKASNYCRPEDAFSPIRCDTEEIRQVAIHFINEPVVVPSLPRPEPLPSGSTNKRADENHRDPQDDEAKEKSSDGELALLPGVVAGAQRVGVYIRNHHQTNDD